MRPALSSAARPLGRGELLRMRPTAPANRPPLENLRAFSLSSEVNQSSTKHYGFRGVKFRKIVELL